MYSKHITPRDGGGLSFQMLKKLQYKAIHKAKPSQILLQLSVQIIEAWRHTVYRTVAYTHVYMLVLLPSYTCTSGTVQ